MDRTERDRLRELVADLRSAGSGARELADLRAAMIAAAQRDERSLAERRVDVPRSGQRTWAVVPLTDDVRADSFAVRAALPPLDGQDRALLAELTEALPGALDAVSPLLGIRRFFTGPAKKQLAEQAAARLDRLHTRVAEGGSDRLDRLRAATEQAGRARADVAELLTPGFRLDVLLADADGAPEILPGARFRGLPAALDTIARALRDEASYRTAAQEAGERVRDHDVRTALENMPVDALRTATRDRLRLGALGQAGIGTVLEVLEHAADLAALPGVGETTARRMVAAARTLRQTEREETPVRVDLAARPPETTELLARLAEWDACRSTRGAAADLERAQELTALGEAMTTGFTDLLVVPTRAVPVAEFADGVRTVLRRADLLDASRRRAEPREKRAPRPADPWADFLARPADYFAMLAELGFLTEDEQASQGDLPEEIVQAVRDQALSGEHLTASLRGYQSFAARFALVQRKVVIGDEMGLGKTVEAIAVLAHLRSRGENRFLVVCPASVLTNWVREVEGKSRLRAHRVHGPERDRVAKQWERDGGVAVTTYETLRWWEGALADHDLACVVVDEAHYVKNPEAARTIRTVALVSRAARAVLLTGTPLENRVSEFRNLVSYLRPDLLVEAEDHAPKAFRRQIAPVYLRRNQEDVLTELPELIEVEEWLPLSEEDERRYWRGVGNGNFQEMRQAALLAGVKSVKLQRLKEIVAEAEENERKVIVFSNYRAVLDLVANALPGEVFGPLTGAVPPARRQQVVDGFSSAEHGAVLVAQIVAGGVGLNIQAASVVVICEPQLKPTTEAQAIARAHRMGQVRTVQVHRLLSEEGVDRRITELLARKAKLFDEFARVSDMADSAPDAIDLSEAELVRQVLDEERKRMAARQQG
ncbi:DEAD/DEAH box helicase family protein [Actinosynnema pretiosum subsp. pretiosum]|uniref:DEAD/DEAH box helicase family protein n=1 Tax=Actinosynnema pretiosum subsp. pretiosum TaxID=103721 RepID=A0AA45R429_9PSEU|nr:Superfamily II DNA/RNA helicase, SNF2 family [Actinosynnema pretiosum subsp. pretiosum]QUF04487.1 DEAD/DEAH box helicase family protein [Actinosynnema pretiosum subsp. pretiosum]